eukprot:CAMPEP_0180117114 /NCGR_PEP_ID=MMETSP0986-20121125/746_1 /TAXON_ID=697907 /ORGANISM="non described non described, Strain CCMP2293" /LENGTH=88 /DNA_ID=CAMNT_0022055967 /DNA_START=487 /DNA_END=753 /DNA_ORIENTATION=+
MSRGERSAPHASRPSEHSDVRQLPSSDQPSISHDWIEEVLRARSSSAALMECSAESTSPAVGSTSRPRARNSIASSALSIISRSLRMR